RILAEPCGVTLTAKVFRQCVWTATWWDVCASTGQPSYLLLKTDFYFHHQLMLHEHFTTLLRAEGLGTRPKRHCCVSDRSRMRLSRGTFPICGCCINQFT